jgi:transposase
MAYLRGDPKVWSVVRVPSVAEEDDRRLHRERDRMIRERVQHVNRIKGLCAVHGIYDYEPMRPNRMLRLEQLRTGDGRKLPPHLKAEIVREFQRLELALTMIKAIETERKVIISAKSPQSMAKRYRISSRSRASDRELLRCWLEGLLPEVQQSPAARELCWVDAEPFQSGPMSRDQGISKAG